MSQKPHSACGKLCLVESEWSRCWEHEDHDWRSGGKALKKSRVLFNVIFVKQMNKVQNIHSPCSKIKPSDDIENLLSYIKSKSFSTSFRLPLIFPPHWKGLGLWINTTIDIYMSIWKGTVGSCLAMWINEGHPQKISEYSMMHRPLGSKWSSCGHGR